MTLGDNATANVGADLIKLAADTDATSAGLITVESGADMLLNGLYLATGAGWGHVNVRGAGSTMTQISGSTLTVGSSYGLVALLSVTESGVFTSGSGVIQVNPSGQIRVNNGTFNANGNLTVATTGTGLDGVPLENQGQIHSRHVIGLATGTTGYVEVLGTAPNGDPSTWTTTSSLVVGEGGFGTMVIADGGQMNIHNGAFIARFAPATGSSVTVSGSGSGWNVTGPLYVGGSDASVGGVAQLRVSDGGLVQADTVKVWQPGTIELYGNIYTSRLWLAGGTLQGSGLVYGPSGSALVNDGSVSPGGAEIGQIVVAGEYFQGGTLNIQLGGPGQGQYVMLDVLGASWLYGVLNVSLLGSYTPAYMSQFDILHGHIEDRLVFSITGTMLSPNRWLAPVYSATGLSLHTVLPGDANLDGVVDGQDFIVWNAHKFTSANDWTSGDFNADGVVDGQDFIIWNTFKFMSVATLVPEPSVPVVLLGLGLFWCIAQQAAFRARQNRDPS